MLSLRPWRSTDGPACDAVFFRAVREGAAGFYDAAQRAAWAPDPDEAGDGDADGDGDGDADGDADGGDRLAGQWCLVAERAGAVVGFMSLTPAGYLDMAFVLPEEMGRGTAGALHDALIDRARAAGLARLDTHASHLARRFLARRGWQVEAAETVDRRGQRLDRFRMSIDLAGARDGRA